MPHFETHSRSAEDDTSAFHFSESHWRCVLRMLKRPWIRDTRGLPLILMSLPAVQKALDLPLAKLMASDSPWESFEEEGYAKMKEAKTNSPKRLRGIFPQSVLYRLMTGFVRYELEPLCDRYSVSYRLDSLVYGGGRGGQPLDIIALAQCGIQYGLDDCNRFLVGQADVENCYDSLRWVDTFLACRRQGLP